jgi:hypothetical protein
MRTFGKSLSTLHRELGMQLTIKAGEFDRIVQPYACDSAALPRILQTDLQRETPHPDYPNMLLDEVAVTRDVAGITRMQATYFGVARSGWNEPKISVKVNSNQYTTGSVQFFRTEFFVTRQFVSDVEPDPSIVGKFFPAEDLGLKPRFTGQKLRCLSNDWNKVGRFYETSQQYSTPPLLVFSAT